MRTRHRARELFASRSCPSIVFACLLLTLGIQPIFVYAQTYTDLHDFNYSTDGGYPGIAGIVAQGRDGNLYGTDRGGPNGNGMVYKITPSGTFTTIYNFSISDGASPAGGLTLGTDGNFYGTTTDGGAKGYGTIFKITPGGTLTTLHSFTGLDGCNPYSPPVLGKKAFYGVTTCGTAYSITASGNFKLLPNPIPGASYAPLSSPTTATSTEPAVTEETGVMARSSSSLRAVGWPSSTASSALMMEAGPLHQDPGE